MRSSGNRIPWVDVAKGITIILMVVGHSSLPNIIQSWIFSFHMPLFFILSGVTTKWDATDWVYFFLKKLVSLGRPFIIYSTTCVLIIYSLHLGDLSFAKGWGDFALWFVPVLLFALIIGKLVLSCNESLKIFLTILLPFISGLLSFHHISLPWNMAAVPYASFFVIIGGLAKGSVAKLDWINWWLLIVFLALTILISHFFTLDMSRNQCLPIIPLTIGAVSGTLFICGISRYIDRYFIRVSQILQSVGRETFIILAFSQVFIMSMNKYFVINPIIKYFLLIAALVVVKYIKDFIIDIYKSLTNHRRL